MPFHDEPGYEVTLEDDGTISFYKRLEMYSTIFHLKKSLLLLYRGDMTSMEIPLTPEERETLDCPSATIAFANEYIQVHGANWQ